VPHTDYKQSSNNVSERNRVQNIIQNLSAKSSTFKKNHSKDYNIQTSKLVFIKKRNHTRQMSKRLKQTTTRNDSTCEAYYGVETTASKPIEFK